MELVEFYRNGDKVVYSTTVSGVTYYFYDGFDSKDNVIETIARNPNYILDRALKQHLLNGVWSKIIK